MTRSAIMGTMYNPFMIRYFLENFKNWQHKVDKEYIIDYFKIDRERIRKYREIIKKLGGEK